MLHGSPVRLVFSLVLLWAISNLAVANPANGSGPEKAFVKSLAGVYEYVYEHNTEDLKENHYIVLEPEDGFLAGRYYGTSDDFDDAREGYLPGFFVAPMRNLSIQGQTISFQIELQPDDLFLKPIDLSITSSQEVGRRKNQRWIKDYQPGIRLTRSSVTYEGEIRNDEFYITTRSGVRVFKKIR